MSDNATQKIKEKLDLVEFLRGYLELRPAGGNLKAYCPFHKEKTPSFMVSPDKQIWHCFGCNEGGDIFKFLMKYENMEFYEALKILAEKAGVELGRVAPSEQKEFGVLYDMHRSAVDFYRESLDGSQTSLEYLSSRGLSKKSVEDFEMGFAPNGYESLTLYLIKKGFDIKDIARAGLASKTEKGNYMDRFRGRIMFPLESGFGKTVGFTGRILPQFDKGDSAKYMNSPETPIFSKSRLLYGLSRSKNGIREKGFILLVEGQMDVIMSHQEGINNAVGTSGTALTENQLVLLRRYSGKLKLNFDNDEAGKMAMERSIDLACAKDFEVEVLDFGSFPEAGGLKDPADIVKTRPGMLERLVSSAVPAMEYYFSRYPVNGDISSKKRNVRILLRKISGAPSAVERSHWLKELSFRSGVKESDLSLEMKTFSSPTAYSRAEIPNVGVKNGGEKKSRKEMIINRLIELSFISDLAKEELGKKKDYLPSAQLAVYNGIVSADPAQNEEIRQKIAELSLKSGLKDESGGEFVEREVIELLKNLELECLFKERDILSAFIKSNKFSGEAEMEETLQKLQEISKRIESEKVKK